MSSAPLALDSFFSRFEGKKLREVRSPRSHLISHTRSFLYKPRLSVTASVELPRNSISASPERGSSQGGGEKGLVHFCQRGVVALDVGGIVSESEDLRAENRRLAWHRASDSTGN